MTATVDATIAIPRRQAAPGGEIVANDGRNGGLRRISRAQNTLCEQHRSAVLSACGSLTTPILTGTGTVAYFRAKLAPRLNYQNETAGAYVDIYVNGGTATVACRFPNSSGGTTTCSAALTAAARSRRSLSGGSIADDVEYVDVELEITASTATTVEIYGLDVVWDRAASSLEVLAAQQQGNADFIPVDDTLTGSERPLSSALMYMMHQNARYLYARTGMVVSSSYPEDTTYLPQVFAATVPEGVTQLNVHVRATGAASKSTTLYIAVGSVSESHSIGVAASAAWYDSTFSVVPGTQILVAYLVSSGASHEACCAWWSDRDTTVAAVDLLADESDNNLVTEDGFYLRT